MNPRGEEEIGAAARERFLDAVAHGVIPMGVARAFAEAPRTGAPVQGPWRFAGLTEKCFDYGNVAGIALRACDDRTGECRRQAFKVSGAGSMGTRWVMLELLFLWLNDLNCDGAPAWPGVAEVAEKERLEGRELRLV